MYFEIYHQSDDQNFKTPINFPVRNFSTSTSQDFLDSFLSQYYI